MTRGISAQPLVVVEILVLAKIAALLAFWLVPLGFGIEWSCIGGTGLAGTRGESFAETLYVVGTVGWFAVLVATLFANIAERFRLAVVLPFVWFVVLVVGMTVAAALVGRAPCPA